MGLDMYLYKQHYISAGSFNKKTDKCEKDKITVIRERQGKKEEILKFDTKDGFTIRECVCYWRKFNALHSWFVENCADGVDDCQPVYVSHEKLQELCSILQKLKDNLKLEKGKVLVAYNVIEEIREDGEVISNPELAEELLPTSEGSFFGSTEYDNYYYEDICRSLDMLDELIKSEDFVEKEFYYEASW